LLNRTTVSGIIGKLSFDRDETLARPVLDRMLDTLARGCRDQRSIHTAPGIALGGCDDLAHPPLATAETPTLRVAADARLTNAAPLREQLERLGHQFRTTSDAEVIAHAAEAWDVEAFARLRGPFACAVWDEQRQRLLIARDHVGVRPLYFALLHNHGVVFASSISALLHDPGVSRQFCPEAIDAYLTYGYVPAPLTAYQRISKLEPAQVLVLEGRRFHVEQYWRLPAIPASRSIDDTCTALDACTRRVIRRQLTRIGREGILYSGGLASTLLLAASPRQAEPAVTICTGDEMTTVNRSDAAATALGRRRELEDVSSSMPAMAAALANQFEEPIADPSAISQFAICAAAAPYGETMLGGHGASALWTGSARPGRVWSDTQRRALYTRAFAWQVRDGNPYTREIASTRDSQLRSFLADNVLAPATRAAAVAGIDLRFPFLDHEFVELAVASRAALTQQGRADVNPMHLVLGRYLPWSLMPQRTQAEHAPRRTRHAWLHLALPALVRATLLTPRFDGRGIVSRPFLARLWDEHQSGRRDHAQRLWSLLVLEFWFREYMDGDAANEPLEYAVLKVA
jgi:asparagine synthase (glutamine-hydrolysing)